MERLLNQPDDKTPLGLRDRAMLEVLYSTGLRVSELINLRVMDLDTGVGCVRCIGKGDKERIVPIGKKAIALVDRYLREARPKLVGKGSRLSPLRFSLIAADHPSAASVFGRFSPHMGVRPDCASVRLRTCCVTVLQRIFWSAALICARSS